MRHKLYTLGALAYTAHRLARRQRRMDFTGSSVLITGGSRGLGLEMARRFAAEGAHLTLLARDADELAQAHKALKRIGPKVVTVKADVARPDEVRHAVEVALERFGRIDVAVHNAGIIQVGPLEHMQRADFEQSMNVHLWGAYNLAETVVPHMKVQGRGRIVHITSINGLVVVPHLAPYTTGKFALVGFSDALRAELAAEGIRVTTVAPGLMRTGSHVNAWFKGRHEKEFAWFSIINAFPAASTASERAARKIVEACRYGDPHLTITLPARLLRIADAVAPSLVGGAMKLVARMLPGTAPDGDMQQRGYESTSAWSPSLLTDPSDRQVVPNKELERYEHD